MEQTKWRKTVSGIIAAIWSYTLAGIGGGVVSFIDGLMTPFNLAEIVESFSSGAGDFDPSGMDIAGWVLDAFVIFGYVYFYLSVSVFVNLQKNETDRLGANKIKSSYILMIVALVLSVIPIVKIVGFILMIVAYVKQIKGYRMLSQSAYYNEKARQGAALLRKSTGWILASIFIGWIPLVGGMLESIILLVTFFLILKGWRLISQNGTSDDVWQPDREYDQSQPSDEIVKYADVLAVKSDDELRLITSYAGSYDAVFVEMAKKELMERTLGNCVQRSREEIEQEQAKREEIRKQKAAERERLQEEEKERLRKKREEQAQKRKVFIRRAAWVALILFVLTLTGVFLYTSNTTEGLVKRSLSAYEKGKTEKAIRLAQRAYSQSRAAYDSSGKTDALEALYYIADNEGDEVQKVEYMRTLADMNVPLYLIRYGLHMADSLKNPIPLSSIRKGSISIEDYSDKRAAYVRFLKKGYDNYDNDDHMKERGRAAYLIANHLYGNNDIEEAKKYWIQAFDLGYKEAKLRLGDYILCHDYTSYYFYNLALKYYKAAPADMLGVKERIDILTKIIDSDSDNWQPHYNGYLHFSDNQTGVIWGCYRLTDFLHYFGQLTRNKNGKIQVVPVTEGFWCDKGDSKASAYRMFVGLISGDDKSKYGYVGALDGCIITSSTGDCYVDDEDSKWYPVEYSWEE